MTRALAALLLAATAARADVTIPSPPFGGVLSLAGGVSASSPQPAWQTINTGAGNAIESYVQTPGRGVILSYQGSTVGSGFDSGASPARPYFALRHEAGFVEFFGNNWDGVGSDFVGGGIVLGGDRGLRGLYADRGYGIVRWEDAFGGTLEFRTLRQGQLFGFASGGSGVNENFIQIANGTSCWYFNARSSNVPASTASYHFGCSAQNRPLHMWWTDSAGNTLAALADAGGGVGRLRVPTGSVSSTDFLPMSDNTGSVGSGSLRFATIRAVTVTTGDLGFEDECCPVCGACFNVGEDVVWRIRHQRREAEGRTVSRAVPVHVGCVR